MNRFWLKVEKKPGGCWAWKAAVRSSGYGAFRYLGRHDVAHRVSWMLTNGDDSIPAGMFVRHRCDVRLCVRPSHLFLGTARDNNVDMVGKTISNTVRREVV